MAFFEFPHTRTYDSDLGWIIKRINEQQDQMDGQAIYMDELKAWMEENEPRIEHIEEVYDLFEQGVLPDEVVEALENWLNTYGVLAQANVYTDEKVGIVQDGLDNEIAARAAGDTALGERIDNIIALTPGSTTGDAELQDIRVGAGGITFNTAGDAVRTQVLELQNIGAINILPPQNRTVTHGGVTYTQTGQITAASGNASGITYYEVLRSQNSMPSWATVGGTYHVHAPGRTKYSLLFYGFVGGVLQGSPFATMGPSTDYAAITIPQGITGLDIRYWASAPGAVSENMSCYISTTPGFDQKLDKTRDGMDLKPLGLYVPASSTFDVWTDMPNNSYCNYNGSYFKDSIIADFVSEISTQYTYQLLKIFDRIYLSCPALSQFYLGQRRTSDGVQFWMTIDNTIFQNIVNQYYNTYNITCTPQIRTDTNNFLASTNNTQDRTGDIQTMLNTTGCCKLGPGVFYVTGVEVPNLAQLSGCGLSTTLILAPSVAFGYTVKLKSYSSVSDMLIKGQSSNYTPQATVGARHGVLFEGNADDVNPTTYYRSKITNLNISDFNGGGITCNNTGGSPAANLEVSDIFITRCDAGVNVAYFSEFHKWTNVCAQDCYYGCIDNGGNNNFCNCDFSWNQVGLLIDNHLDQSRNNSHGTFSACNFNHSGGNTGTAIRILKASAGEIFTGCQIFYGSVEIDDSIGIRFLGANIGRQVPIEVTNSTVVTFSDCTMYSTSENPVTESNNNVLTFTNCYTRSGAAFTG